MNPGQLVIVVLGGLMASTGFLWATGLLPWQVVFTPALFLAGAICTGLALFLLEERRR